MGKKTAVAGNDLPDRMIRFYRGLKMDFPLPEGVVVMNPYRDPEVLRVMSSFFRRFYSVERERIFVFGINPGRFGAGVTGITFTDPVRHEKVCGISSSFEKLPELSSVFIYEMISRFGGPEAFYSRFFLTAVSPLGFLKGGKNMNFYDDRALQSSLEDFIMSSIREQMGFGADRNLAVCLGEGKNYKYFARLNEKYGFFERIIPLAHPRFIMQYRMKRKEEYLEKYLEVLRPSRV
jgi:hypothetical protein